MSDLRQSAGSYSVESSFRQTDELLFNIWLMAVFENKNLTTIYQNKKLLCYVVSHLFIVVSIDKV